MEEHGYLDTLNELHLYALHFVFLPRICQSLLMFKKGWNSHKVRTTGKSPHQMFTTSRIYNLETIDDRYGIEEDGPLVYGSDSEGLQVPPVQVSLSDAAMDRISTVDPLAESDNLGLDILSESFASVDTVINNCFIKN